MRLLKEKVSKLLTQKDTGVANVCVRLIGMAVYSPGNPLGAGRDFKIMEDRAVGSINSLPLVMKSQVGGYLFGSPLGSEEFIVKDASKTSTAIGKVTQKTGSPLIKPITRPQGGSRKNMRKLERMANTRRNHKNGGGIFSPESHSSSDEGFGIKSTIKKSIAGGRRTMRQGKGSAGSWAKAVTKYYKAQKKTRKALKFSEALKEAAKLKRSGKLMY